MIHPNFNKAMEKGNFAEDIIQQILEKKGFVVYKPLTDGAHAFDIMAIKDKKKVIAIDVKAKARRTKYNDTGINLSHFNEYMYFSTSHNMDFWVIFVDEYEKSIYGNTLAELQKPYTIDGINYPMISKTSNGKDIIYFPLVIMHQLCTLTEQQASELKAMSQRNYGYMEKA